MNKPLLPLYFDTKDSIKECLHRVVITITEGKKKEPEEHCHVAIAMPNPDDDDNEREYLILPDNC